MPVVSSLYHFLATSLPYTQLGMVSNFPRIASLDALPELEEDEQWAVQMAEAIVTQASQQHRTVFAVQPSVTTLTNATPLRTFDPMAKSMIVVARVAGG